MVRVRESGGDWGKHNVEGEYCRGRILQAVRRAGFTFVPSDSFRTRFCSYIKRDTTGSDTRVVPIYKVPKQA